MIVKRVVTAIALASLMGIILPVASAQAPPCFTFADGQIQAIQCSASFRPTAPYYSSVENGIIKASQEEQQEEPAPAQGNQTSAPPATNLNSADIEAIRDSLKSTRESLEQNDTQAAVESINRADGSLFAIIREEAKGPVRDGLITLSNDTDRTRKSVFTLDNGKALKDLDVADSQLAFITEMLSIPTSIATATEVPQPEPLTQQNQNLTQSENVTQTVPAPPLISQAPQNQNETQSPLIVLQGNTTEPKPELQPLEQEATITVKIPLNNTQQEIITIEEGAGLNKTTHEKTTISIIEGNKTTHSEITTSEVPL